MSLHFKKIHIYHTLLILCSIQIFFFNTHVFSEQEVIETPTADILEKPIFKEGEQGSVQIQPAFNNRTTNIAFYIKCPSVSCMNYGTQELPVFHFSAENIGHGHSAFSNYWAPPDSSEYVAIEYVNDQQQFTCSDLSLEECIADPHFISKFHFKIVDDNTVITEVALESIAKVNDENQEKDIPESITSDLADGKTVTSHIDGIMEKASSTFKLPSEDTTISSSTASPTSSQGVYVSETITAPVLTSTTETEVETVQSATGIGEVTTATF